MNSAVYNSIQLKHTETYRNAFSISCPGQLASSAATPVSNILCSHSVPSATSFFRMRQSGMRLRGEDSSPRLAWLIYMFFSCVSLFCGSSKGQDAAVWCYICYVVKRTVYQIFGIDVTLMSHWCPMYRFFSSLEAAGRSTVAARHSPRAGRVFLRQIFLTSQADLRNIDLSQTT